MTNKQMRRDMRRLEKLMEDTRLVAVNISVADLWIMVTTLQLAWRHPGLSKAMKDQIQDFTRQISQAILVLHPEMTNLLEMGWIEEHDVPVERGKDHD